MAAKPAEAHLAIPTVAQGIEMDDMKSHRDDDDLNRLGKVPVLKRNFGLMSILGFSCTVVITWEAFLFCFAPAFANGGPAGAIYGFILVWFGTLCVFTTLAEAQSMAPTSGGQYHWVAMLAPPQWQSFLSYITGWLTCLGWQAFVASGAFLCGSMMEGLIILKDTDLSYTPQPWHSMMLFWAAILFCVFINTVASSWLPRLEAMILVIHILGFFAIIIPLLTLGPRAKPSQVFGEFINIGEWPTQGLSFMVGLLGNVYTFFGADGPIHMSEEIQNASTVVPRAIVASIVLNGAMGLGMALTLLFVIGDINKALNTPTGEPFMEIFAQAVRSIDGAAGMSAIIIILAISSTVGIVASASRQLWSFSRDRALPGWRYLEMVSAGQIPVIAILVTLVFSILLSLIILGSSIAFNDILSLSVVGLFGSYLMVVILMFWRRLRGDIKPYETATEHEFTNIPGAPLVWGPWAFKGIFGTIINGIAIVYLIVIFFFVQWPPENHPTPATMNYSCVMFGFTMMFSVAYYFLYARKVWTGVVLQTHGQ